MKISRTPLRISFLGGGTDYPQWYNEHRGAVLGVSIDKYCYVALHNGRLWSIFDLPTKSGLASSSAYTVGLIRVCSDLDNVTISRLATTWEQDKTNGMVGSQDQYLCAVGGFHHLKFSEHGVRDIPLGSGIVAPLQQYLMLFDTHQYRVNREIIPQQLKEMKEHSLIYNRLVAIVDFGVEALLKQDFVRFGHLLDDAWQMKRQLSNNITTPQIDAIYETAIKTGAIGGKLLGGGGGGFFLLFVEPEKQSAVKEALSDLTYVPFKFESEGTRVIYEGI